MWARRNHVARALPLSRLDRRHRQIAEAPSVGAVTRMSDHASQFAALGQLKSAVSDGPSCQPESGICRGLRHSELAAVHVEPPFSLGPVVSRQFRGFGGSLCAASQHKSCVLATGASAVPHCEADVVILWLSS